MAKVVGLPPEFVAQARNSPWWPAQEALAHTLAYDATIIGDYSLPTKLAASVTTPTAVIAGGATWDWMRATARPSPRRFPMASTAFWPGRSTTWTPRSSPRR